MKKWIWVVLLVPLIVYLPTLGKFAFPSLSQYSDLLISHWPNANFVHNSIFSLRELPLWSDAILAGYPFFANPLAGLWYLPNWVTFLFPYPIAFNLLFFAHIFIGGLSVFLLLRDENIPPEIALLAGLMFELMPKIWAHFDQGHISLIYAVCLTPILLLITRRAIIGQSGNKYRYFPGIILGAIILADPRWGIYAILTMTVYIASIFGQQKDELKSRFRPTLVFLISQVIIGVLLAAVLLLPMFEYANLSTRSLMTLTDNLIFSLPISKILFMIFPFIGESAEWVFYLGGVGFISIILALLNGIIRRRSVYWLTLFGLGIFISISGTIPFVSRFWEIPLLNLARVPSRALFLCGISVSFISAYSLETILNKKIDKKRTNLCLAGLIGFGILFLIFSFFSSRNEINGLRIGSFSLLITSGLFFILANKPHPNPSWTWLLILIVLLDFGTINALSIKFLDFEDAFKKGQTLSNSIELNKREDFRIFSPSYSIPQHLASRDGIEMVNGVDPLQLQSIQNFMQFRTISGTRLDGYNVAFPPFLTGKPEVDNKDLFLEPDKLGLLNVRYVISTFPLDFIGLNLLNHTAEGFVYENKFWLPRVWIQNPESPLGKDIFEAVNYSRTNNTFTVETKNEGILVLSEIMYPGWKAAIDGKPVEILIQDDLLRSVLIPAGHHVVTFHFQPESLYIGIIISFFTLIILVCWFLIERKSIHDRS
jgi:hypothetical protein